VPRHETGARTIAPAAFEAAAGDDFAALLVEVAVFSGETTEEPAVALTTLRLAATPSEERP
jgi:hypothetical protein